MEFTIIHLITGTTTQKKKSSKKFEWVRYKENHLCLAFSKLLHCLNTDKPMTTMEFISNNNFKITPTTTNSLLKLKITFSNYNSFLNLIVKQFKFTKQRGQKKIRRQFSDNMLTVHRTDFIEITVPKCTNTQLWK